MWDETTWYLWGANVGNYRQGPIGTLIGGDGLAGVNGPSRGRYHPHYVGLITMTVADLPENAPVFAALAARVDGGGSVVVPVYDTAEGGPPTLKLSLGTGIAAGQPGWGAIQRSILSGIVKLGQRCGAVKIPAGVYWPDCRTPEPCVRYPVATLADIEHIVDAVLAPGPAD